MNIDAKNIMSSYLMLDDEEYSVKSGLSNHDYVSTNKIKQLNKNLSDKPFEGPIPSNNKLYITLDQEGNPRCSFTGFEHKNKYVPMNYLTKKAYNETMKKNNSIDKVYLPVGKGGFVNLSSVEDLEKKRKKASTGSRSRSKSRSKSTKTSSRSKSRGNKLSEKSMSKVKAGGIIADNIKKLDPDNVQVLTNILTSLTAK